MSTNSHILIAAIGIVAFLSGTEARYIFARKCEGVAKYNVTSTWRGRAPFWRHRTLWRGVQPLTAAAHKSRFSPFAPYSYATKPVEMVAESGANAMLVKTLNENPMVGNVAALSKPTSNVGPARVVVTVDADKGYTHLSAIGMLAPTPDWVTFFNNVNVCYRGWWLPSLSGRLYGWDAGTEKTMGVDQQPRQNIYRLQAPRYPRYGKYPVGYFTIPKM